MRLKYTKQKSAMTETVIESLLEAFKLGATDAEACLRAGISLTTLMHFQRRNPHFYEQKQLLKLTPVLRARKTVCEALECDPNLAFKFLERKARAEFGVQNQSAQVNLTITNEHAQRILNVPTIELSQNVENQRGLIEASEIQKTDTMFD